MASLLAAAAACLAMFSAQDAPGNHAVFASDGTAGGTAKLADIGPVGYITPIANGAIFSAQTVANGRELFKSIGTPATTGLLKDIFAGSSFSAEPRTYATATLSNAWDRELKFVKVGNRYLFGASSANRGFELWRSSGTAASTALVKEFMPSTVNGLRDVLASTNTFALVVAEDSVQGDSLWATDGTGAGTRFLLRERGINGSQGILATQLDATRILFTQDKGNTLWITDGTRPGTQRIRSFPTCATGAAFEHIKHLRGFPSLGYALFSGCTTGSGHELWKTDGTASGTKIVRNIMIGPSSSEPSNFYQHGTTVYFSAFSDGKGREIWKTQGTAQTTRLVADIRPGPDSSNPQWFKTFGSRVVFAAEINGFGAKWLHSTAGTGASTQQIDSAFVTSALVNIGTKLIFGGGFAGGGIGNELMGTRGTVGSTNLVSDIFPGFGGSSPSGIAAVRVVQPGFVTPAQCPAN